MGLGEWHKRVMGGAKGLVLTPPIAIDFGVGALKVLQLAGGEPAVLQAAACLPTPDELLADASKRLAFQIEALPALVASVEFKGKRAVCSIPAASSLVKHMQLQPESGVSIGDLVQSAIPAQLGCDPSALVFRHSVVGQVGRKTEVICMAAARETVQRLMNAIKASKLEPVGMHSEFHATLRAFDSSTRRTEDERLTSLYLDIGAGATKVSIASGRELVFARTIELGGRHLDKAVAKQLRMDLDAAREYRLKMAEIGRRSVRAQSPALASAGAGGGGGEVAVLEDRRQGAAPAGFTPDLTSQPAMLSAPGADLSEPLEILTDEISMCLRYHESIFPDRKVGRSIFVGGEARHLGLCQHVARTLKLPAQVGDPMASVSRSGEEPVSGVDFTKSQPGWTVALGLCLSPTDL
jgi:Tfp pilus assembly PilM family ATPase